MEASQNIYKIKRKRRGTWSKHLGIIRKPISIVFSYVLFENEVMHALAKLAESRAWRWRWSVGHLVSKKSMQFGLGHVGTKELQHLAKNHKIARIKTDIRRFCTAKCEPRSFRTTSYLSFEMPWGTWHAASWGALQRRRRQIIRRIRRVGQTWTDMDRQFISIYADESG